VWCICCTRPKMDVFIKRHVESADPAPRKKSGFFI